MIKDLFPFIRQVEEIDLVRVIKQAGVDPFDHPAVNEILRKRGEVVTFGGYWEWREEIWKGSYLDKDLRYMHLGVDINVPATTTVHTPFDATVVDVFADKEEDLGWGGRVIIQHDRGLPFLLLAHLDPERLPSVGTRLLKGSVLGYVGSAPTNGNTFDHLHIQSIKHPAGLMNLDGYGFGSPSEKHLYPNPLTTFFV